MDQQEATIAPLAGANMPADRGLTGLGLLMQMIGSVFMAYGAFLVMMPMLSGPGVGSTRMMMLLASVSCMVRSVYHRSAGRALLYGSAKGPLHDVKVYIGVALAQTAALYVLLGDILPSEVRIYLCILLCAWPVTLAIVLAQPQFKGLDTKIPHAEDMGFESAAVMMTIFGILGAMTCGLVIITIFQEPFFRLSDVPSFLWVGILGMLFIRSVLHAKAGLQGCQGVRAEQATASAARYFNFGIMSAIITAAVIMLQMIMKLGTLHLMIFASVGVMGYLLLSWPLMLRTFYTDRNFSMLIEEEKSIPRRAPDTGLTALGWLLLALGSFALASSLGTMLISDTVGARGAQEMLMIGNLNAPTDHSQWWNVGVALLQTAALFELIRMSPRHKLVTTVYGVGSGLVTLYLWWPLLKQISNPHFGGPLGSLQVFGILLISLALAVSAVVLVNRQTAPDARARITED